MQNIKISRYPTQKHVTSDLNLLDDALDLLSFIKAEDFVTDLLINKHGKSLKDSRMLSKRIASHIELADKYAHLSLNSAPEISFLPGYYSILNLAKCVSLSGPYYNEFDKHSRWHGATYDVQAKSIHSILNDEIIVRRGGALALFYKTLTNRIIKKDKKIKLRDFYYLIPGISAELGTAKGNLKHEWLLYLKADENLTHITLEAEVKRFDLTGNEIYYDGSVRFIPCLQGFRKKPGNIGFFNKKIRKSHGKTLDEDIRSTLRTEFIYYTDEYNPYAFFEQSSIMPMPNEFAIALAFFHLSSVCRYNPELIKKLSISKFWPTFLSLRKQGLYFFIIAIWSYFTQQDYILKHSFIKFKIL